MSGARGMGAKDGKRQRRGLESIRCNQPSLPRYSATRWKIQAKKIAKKLGEYDYKDIRRQLRDWAFGRRRSGSRRSVAAYMPNDKQLQWLLAHAEWSVQVEPQRNHTPARYCYYEKDDMPKRHTES